MRCASGEERGGIFGVSCGDSAPSFEVQESVLDEVAEFVDAFVIQPLHDTVFLQRDDGVHAALLRQIKDCVGIVTLVCNQMSGVDPLDQAASLCTIRCGTLCNKGSDRHTIRIHSPMYFGVEPPFVRPIS